MFELHELGRDVTNAAVRSISMSPFKWQLIYAADFGIKQKRLVINVQYEKSKE